MANVSDELSLLIGDVTIPEIFVVQYMEQLNKNAAYLYMWLKLAFGNLNFTEEQAFKSAPYSESDIRESLAELIQVGLLLLKNNTYTFVDLKKREVNSYCKAVAALGINPDTLQLTADEETRNVLASSINKSCFNGKMAYCYYALIDKCIGEYDFSNEVVYYLFEIAKQKRIQYQYSSMCRLAEEWYKQGIISVDKVDMYLKREEDVAKMSKLVGKLTRKRLNEFDLNRIRKWVIDYKFQPELVEYAFRVNEYRGNLTTQIVEDTLALWLENGINSVESATVFEDEKHKENKRKASKRKNKTTGWKTGAEAGISGETGDNEESSVENVQALQSDISSDVQDENDDILNLFEDEDEDN